MNKASKCLLLVLGLMIGFSVKAQAVQAATINFDKTGYYYTRQNGDGSNRHSWFLKNYYVDGQVAYCIDPGIPEGNPMYEVGWDATGLPNSIKERVTLIAYYGYTYPEHQTLQYKAAAQGMIWSEILGNGTTVSYSTGRWGAGTQLDVSAEKAEIERLIANHYIRPSFNGSVYKLQVGETLTLTDTNGVLGDYNVSVSGADYNVNGNTLTIKPTTNGTINLTMTKKMPYSSSYKLFVGDGVQNMIVPGTTDPVIAGIRVNSYYGAFTINKTNAVCPSVTAYSGAYDGASHGVGIGGGSGGTVQYRTSTTGSWSNTKPTIKDKGSITTYVQVVGDSNHNTVDCGNKTVTVTAKTITPAAQSASYNGKTTFTKTISTGVGSEDLTLTYTTNVATAGTYSYATSLSVGKYTLSSADKTGKASNYTISNPGAFTISKVGATNPTLTAYSGTYDGKAHTIEVTGGSGGTIQYSTDQKTWSTTKPTRTDQGKTTVYVKVVGDSNHNDTSVISSTITIKPKNLTGSVKISGSATGGSTLTATVTNTNSATLKYQWYYTDNEKATGGTAITNATANTYVIDTSLLGKYIYVVVTASKVNYNTATWTDITTTPISSSKLSTPTNIKVSTEGIVTWDSVQNATGYEISIDNTNWISASSGINYNDVITKTTDDKIVYVKATADKYADSDSGKSSTVKVYSLTLKKETGISKVTGNGNYISGRTVSISATATSGYTFSKWTGATVTNAGSANTTVKVTAATTVTATATANVYTVTLNSKNEKIDSSDSWTLSSDSSTATKKITFNTAYSNLPNASKDGYSFEGWFTESGTQITSTSTFNVAGNQTLYAHYLSAPVIDGGSAEWAQSRTITVATDATSDTGISKYQYYLSTSNSSLDGGTWTDLSSSKSETFKSTMSKYIYFRAVSTNGTEGPISNYQVVRIDVQKPSATITGYKAGVGTAVRTNTWSDTVLNFMFKSEDIHQGGSGVTIYYCGDTTNTCTPSKIATKDTAIDDYQNTVTMPFYVRYKLISGSGVESGIGTYTARVDTVTPSATITGYKAGSSTEVASGVWSDTGLNFTFYDKNVKKGKSGGTIKYCFDRANTCTPSYEYSSNITNLNNLEGHFYIRYQITSGAGKSSNVFSHIANVDTVTPSVDILGYKAGIGTTVSSGTWSNAGLNFKFQNVKCGASTCTIKYCGDRNNTCTPNTSVSVSNAGNAITTWNGLNETYYVRYTISSQAKTTSTDVYTARVDTDNPTYSISRSGSTVTATCSDKTSSVSGGKTITLSSSNKAISGTCTDSAGNTTSYYKSYTYSQSSACGYKYNVITTDCTKEGGHYVSPSYCGGSATNCCAIPKSCWH